MSLQDTKKKLKNILERIINSMIDDQRLPLDIEADDMNSREICELCKIGSVDVMNKRKRKAAYKLSSWWA